MAASRPPAHHRESHSHPDVAAQIVSVLERLREHGGRITSGRRAVVVALLRHDDHHVTADDIAAVVQADQPDIHLSTVYRTLEALEQVDVVSRVDLGQGRAVYHLVDHVHHHLVCDRCGSVTEVPASVVEPLTQALDDRFSFAASSTRLTISGLCSSCR